MTLSSSFTPWRALVLLAALALLGVPAAQAQSDLPARTTERGPTAEETGIPTNADSWGMYGKDYTQSRFSPLEQINADNVAGLEVAWMAPLGVNEAFEGTPLMVNETLYVTTPMGPKFVYAFDAATGALKWQRQFDIPGDVGRYACCGIVNRAASYAAGRLFVGTLDGRLIAMDADSGETLWETTVVDYEQGSVITSPPTVIGDKVITGFGGGEYGASGAIHAYNAASGEKVWEMTTTPEEVRDTWKGDSWKTGGAAAWFVGSYDPDLNLVYYGTSNASPWSAATRGPDTSDYGDITNLYSASTLGINPDNGEIVWHYQTTPYDAWDYDGTNEKVIADLEIDGQTRQVVMQADRNGFFYVNDRETGELISANNFQPANWAEGIDMETGRPIENPSKRPKAGTTAEDVHPSFLGGKNWEPMSYNPETGLVYIPANDLTMDMTATDEVAYMRGMFYLGAEWDMVTGPSGHPGYLQAWNPVTQEEAWSVPQKYPINGGTMTTAGNLVFYGNLEGEAQAYNAETGAKLWSFNVGSGINSGPMTYAVDGKQYVAYTVGRPTVIPGFVGGDLGKQMVEETPAGGMLVVFALPE
jgi:PQQ-dependent dehydrogenase (methanol/ethanol family)